MSDDTEGSHHAKTHGRLGKKLLLLVCSSLLTLLVLEVLARVYVMHVADESHFSRYASLRQYQEKFSHDDMRWWFGLLTPHRYLGYIPSPNLVVGENRHNSLGYRGEEIELPKPKGEFRIVCLGESTTYDVCVPDYRQAYPAVLERELRRRGLGHVKVVNGGVSSWTSYEHLINFLIRIQDLEPDMIIVNAVFGDVQSRLVWPPTAYKGDNSGYLAPSFAYKPPSLYEESTLLRILLINLGMTLPQSALGKSVFNEADTSYYFEYGSQRFRGRYPSGIFVNTPVKDMLAANPPVYYRRNLENLVLIAKQRGIVPVLMTFAYSAEAGKMWLGTEGFEEAIKVHNGILLEISEEQKTPFMDMASALSKDKEYWAPDGIHSNAAGAALKARLLADFLVEQKLIPANAQASLAE